MTDLELDGSASIRLTVTTPVTTAELQIPQPGLYNAYNALAAVAAATHFQVPGRSLAGVETVPAAPLRMERVQVAGHAVCLAVADNAAGYTEVLRTVLCDQAPGRMLLGLGDSPGGQPGAGWIWDVDFDGFAGRVPAPVMTGSRAADLAVRLRYAGWLGDGQPPPAVVEPDPVRAFQVALAQTPAGQPLWIVATSAELARIRRRLRAQGYLREIRAEQDEHRLARPAPARGRPARIRIPRPESVLSASVLSDLSDTAPADAVLSGPALDEAALDGPALDEAALDGPALNEAAPSETVLNEPVVTETVLTDTALTETVLTETVLSGPAPDTVAASAMPGAVSSKSARNARKKARKKPRSGASR